MQSHASDAKEGLLLIISGPSGVGKTTVARSVEQHRGGVFSVSMTTRPPAEGDVEGQDYYFVDHATFKQRIEEGQLLEWAGVFDDYYGTPRGPVEASLDAGKLVILEIDVQGAQQVKAKLPGSYAIFVLPPSEETLLSRLRERRRDDEATIQKRFARAQDEIAQAKAAGIYDAFIVNDDLQKSIDHALSLVDEQQPRHADAGG
jgi:guanylate kinase